MLSNLANIVFGFLETRFHTICNWERDLYRFQLSKNKYIYHYIIVVVVNYFVVLSVYDYVECYRN